VEVRLVDEAMNDVPPGTPGEIIVRGPGVFMEYWRQPEATAQSFHDGWFLTGDVAVVEGGRYRILGRKNIDIIKTGGYKVSALEIEDVLRDHPAIRECAVVGLPDPEWGQLVCVAVEVERGMDLTLDELRAWAADRLAPTARGRRGVLDSWEAQQRPLWPSALRTRAGLASSGRVSPHDAGRPYSILISAVEEKVSVGPRTFPLTSWTRPARGVIRS
jgi:acyl-CoA synthetase (AMP-forming)/AMP-acid ligase II